MHQKEENLIISLPPPPLTNNIAKLKTWDQSSTLTSRPVGYCAMARTRLTSFPKMVPTFAVCHNCPAVHIDEWGRAFRIRIEDHIRADKKGSYTKSLQFENRVRMLMLFVGVIKWITFRNCMKLLTLFHFKTNYSQVRTIRLGNIAQEGRVFECSISD